MMFSFYLYTGGVINHRINPTSFHVFDVAHSCLVIFRLETQIAPICNGRDIRQVILQLSSQHTLLCILFLSRSDNHLYLLSNNHLCLSINSQLFLPSRGSFTFTYNHEQKNDIIFIHNPVPSYCRFLILASRGIMFLLNSAFVAFIKGVECLISCQKNADRERKDDLRRPTLFLISHRRQ